MEVHQMFMMIWSITVEVCADYSWCLLAAAGIRLPASLCCTALNSICVISIAMKTHCTRLVMI